MIILAVTIILTLNKNNTLSSDKVAIFRQDIATMKEELEIFKANDCEEKYEIGYSNHDGNFQYKLGEFVFPNDFDDNRWEECSSGIHFFITLQEAIDY